MPTQVVFVDAYLAPPIGTLTANAVLYKPRSGSFTADAVISIGQTTWLYVGVASAGKWATSEDGVTWTTHTTGTADSMWAVAVSDQGVWVAVTTNGKFLRSEDPTAGWTIYDSGDTKQFVGVAHNGADTWVAVGEGEVIWSSPDGITWTQRRSYVDSNHWLYDVTWDGSQFVAVGQDFTPTPDVGTVYTSPNGTTWTQRTNPSSGGLTFTACVSVASDSNGVLVAMGNITSSTASGKAAYSTDGGTSWTIVSTPWIGATTNPTVVRWGGDRFLAIGRKTGSSAQTAWSSGITSWTSIGSVPSDFRTGNALTHGAVWLMTYQDGSSVDHTATHPTGSQLDSWSGNSGAITGGNVVRGLASYQFFRAVPTFTADAYFAGPAYGSFSANAVIAALSFKANAAIKRLDTTRTFTANAFTAVINDPGPDTTSDRNRHDRAQSHFGNMLANDVAHGQYTTVEERLRYLWNALSAQEDTDG